MNSDLTAHLHAYLFTIRHIFSGVSTARAARAKPGDLYAKKPPEWLPAVRSLSINIYIIVCINWWKVFLST